MSACDILVIANLNMDLILEQKNSQALRGLLHAFARRKRLQ